MEISDVKSKLGGMVQYNGSDYKFTGCILRRDNDGNLIYQAEVKDIKANSIIICRLKDIK